LRRRRGDAALENGLPRQGGKGEVVSHDERREPKERPDAHEEPDWTEDDVSLKPLARALLALAEQLNREEGP
jgi:hypothetical protein